MGLIESKYKNSRVAKSNGDVKKSKTIANCNAVENGHCYSDQKSKGNEASKTMNGGLLNAGKDTNNTKKVKKSKVFHSRKIESGKVTNNSGHKSNHGKTKEDSDQKNKWTTIPRSAHSTIERLIKSLDYQIVEFSVNIDDKSSILAEKTSVLKYKTPHFRAKASVIVPALEKGDQAVVGWIQVVNSMIFVNRYGDYGLSSWEFPELTTGRQMMISDSDGHRYPWYGSKKEVAVLKGPTSSPSMLTVIMNDNFSPQVTWFVPAPNHRKTCKEAKLTRVFRKQSFTACLAVMKVANNGSLNTQTEIHQSPFNPDLSTASSSPYNGLSILRGIKWELKVDIHIDPSKSIGERSTIPNGHLSTNQYFTINDPDILAGILDLSALHPPNANKSQTLIWRPFTLSMLRPNSTTATSYATSTKNHPANNNTAISGSSAVNNHPNNKTTAVESSSGADISHYPPPQTSTSIDNLSNTFCTFSESNSASPSSSFSSSPPNLLTSAPNKVISPSLSSINNLSSTTEPSFTPQTHTKTASSSLSSSSSSSSSSSPLANPDKNHTKLNSSVSTDPLHFDQSSKTSSPALPETKKSISHSTLSATATPITKAYPQSHAHNNQNNPLFKKFGTTKKSRVLTNDRNKLHQSKLPPLKLPCVNASDNNGDNKCDKNDDNKCDKNGDNKCDKNVAKNGGSNGNDKDGGSGGSKGDDKIGGSGDNGGGGDKNDVFMPLKVETVIVQPSYTKVDMLGYLRMTKGLSGLLHKCVVNEVEDC